MPSTGTASRRTTSDNVSEPSTVNVANGIQPMSSSAAMAPVSEPLSPAQSIDFGGSVDSQPQRRRPFGTPNHSRVNSRTTHTRRTLSSTTKDLNESVTSPGVLRQSQAYPPGRSPLVTEGSQFATNGSGVMVLGSPGVEEINSLAVSYDGRSRYGATPTPPPSVAIPGRRNWPGRAGMGPDGRALMPNDRAGSDDSVGEHREAPGSAPSSDREKTSGVTDPSTAPADPDKDVVDQNASRHHLTSRELGERQHRIVEEVSARGQDTEWTLMPESILFAWLAGLLAYVAGLLAMGTASWRVMATIPDTAGANNAADVPQTAGNVTAVQGLTEDPCGNKIPNSLIAIAFFTVASAVLILGWIVFFGVLVLPKLRNYRPGVGRVPFTVMSVFTPFVAYSTVVSLFLLTCGAVCLYSLSITRLDDKYREDICGSPFVTLRIVGIVYLATTFVLLALYGVSRYVFVRRARKANSAQQASQFTIVRNVVY
jgi:uncharacterized membrane protein